MLLLVVVIGRDIAVGLIDRAHLDKWDALEVGQVSVEIKCDKYVSPLLPLIYRSLSLHTYIDVKEAAS